MLGKNGINNMLQLITQTVVLSQRLPLQQALTELPALADTAILIQEPEYNMTQLEQLQAQHQK